MSWLRISCLVYGVGGGVGFAVALGFLGGVGGVGLVVLIGLLGLGLFGIATPSACSLDNPGPAA